MEKREVKFMAVLQTGSRHRKNVNERSAMQMTAVYSCVRILSEAVASLHFMCTNITQRVERERLLHCIP